MKKIICILLCLTLAIMPLMLTGCDKDTGDDVPTDAPTSAPTDAPTDVPTDAPTDTPTDEPTDVPTGEPTDTSEPTPPTAEPSEVLTDDPSSYAKLYPAFEAILAVAGDIESDWFEQIFDGSESFDCGSFGASLKSLSFMKEDMLDGKTYSASGSFGYDEKKGMILRSELKGNATSGTDLIVTPSGEVYVRLPAVDNELFLKLFDLSGISGGTATPLAMGGGNPDATKVFSSVIEERGVMVNLIDGTSVTGATRITARTDAKAFVALLDKEELPEFISSLIDSLIPDGATDGADITVTVYKKDGKTLCVTAESASSNGNFKLGFSAIGETGRESYGFVLAVDSEGTEGSVTLNGKRENGEGLTKGSLELTVVGFDGNENADGSAVGSFDIAAVTDSGTVIGFSYSRATVGATTSSDYVIRFGVSMGIGSLTLSIPAHAETVRGENGSLTHTFTVNTSAAGIKKELVDVDISLTFAVGATPSDVELTFPTVTEDKVISLTDPDDADAVKAYLENAEREYREIVELIRGLIGNADTDTDAGADAEK